MVAGVQVRAADPAPQDLDRDLPLARLWIRQIDYLELRAFAADGPHLSGDQPTRGSRSRINAPIRCARCAASTSPSPAEMIEPFIRMCQRRGGACGAGGRGARARARPR